MDWADTDTAVRLAARRVMSEFEVEGDSYGVPTIEDIAEALVARIEAQNSELSERGPLSNDCNKSDTRASLE